MNFFISSYISDTTLYGLPYLDCFCQREWFKNGLKSVRHLWQFQLVIEYGQLSCLEGKKEAFKNSCWCGWEDRNIKYSFKLSISSDQVEMHTKYHHISHIAILQVFIEKAAVYFNYFFPISTVTWILFNDYYKDII